MTTDHTPWASYKLSGDHAAFIEHKVRRVLARTGVSPVIYQDQGLSPMRFRWDVLVVAGIRLRSAGLVPPDAVPMNSCSDIYTNGEGTYYVPVYSYADDTHVDTVLRHIMRRAYSEDGHLVSYKWAAQK